MVTRVVDAISATITEVQMPSGPRSIGSKMTAPVSKTSVLMKLMTAETTPLPKLVNSDEPKIEKPISKKAIE